MKALLSNWKTGLLTQVSWQRKATVLLQVISFGLAVYLIILIATMPMYIRKMKESVPQTGRTEFQTLPSLGEVSAYQAVINKTPVFGTVRLQTTPVRSPCDEFKAKFSLSGIVGGAQVEALFNSKVGGATHLANVGDSVEGVLVESIQENKVVINCSGQRFDMMMEES
ncbi:MAG: hypothetical protein HY582_03070 [Candidatus Omnitrophica bacterium]|nr:hypothetical protein [Candidatus Omnitrophota bacterium]